MHSSTIRIKPFTRLATLCAALLLLLPASPLPAVASTLSDVAQPVPGSLALGSEHTCAIQGGAVRCWGKNDSGQLGDGSVTNRANPTGVSGLKTPIKKIAAGGYFTCALSALGEVQCWGANAFGQLGDGTSTDRAVPVTVAGLGAGVRDIILGDTHACAILADGDVACWGRNDLGQLGDGTVTSRTRPVSAAGGQSMLSLAAGWGHTCAVTSFGGVMCWGNNAYGQLGDGTFNSHPTPAAVPTLTSGVTAVVAGDNVTCALSDAGAVKCWGDNWGLADRDQRLRHQRQRKRAAPPSR